MHYPEQSVNDFFSLTVSLNEEQNMYFYEALRRIKTTTEPFYLSRSGGAGVGKSHLLKTTYQALVRYFDSVPGENPDDIKVVIAAPTGKAVYNVHGNTLHSLLNIPPSNALKSYIPLSNRTLNT